MRTARVEIGGKPKGTGFLIGNSLLLRAWHVVERYDDNGGIAIFDNKVSVPGKDERQAARTVAFATEWLVARSCSLSVREAGGTPLARRTGPSGQGTNSVTEARMASNHTPERCLEAAFRFLLDREPKESILGRFDVTVISRYFPEFERELPHYLSRS